MRPFHRVLPGVYAVGHPATGRSERLAEAWLYGGSESVLCGRGAGMFWKLGAFSKIDVAAPGWRRGTGDVVFHRLSLARNEWMTREGLRVTTPARTLLDLAAILPPPALQRVFTEAEVLQLIDQAAISRILAAHPGARGTRMLSELAGLDAGVPRLGAVRSQFEIRYRKLVESTDLDVPRYNHRIEACGCVYVLDAFHERAQVAIEVDGPSHGAHERFHTDRERDRHLLVVGIRTVRLTEQHFERPETLYGDLVAIVGRRGRA